ncbi:MAG: anhydro-N-acetylmuramic acid kinase [Pseudomonadota bacterium]
MTSSQTHYIGIMSGTSLDGIDAVLTSFEPTPHIHCTHSIDIPKALKIAIEALCQPGDNEINRSAQMDRLLGEQFARCAIELIEKAQLTANDIVAIGCHGQTIRHQPHGRFPYSLQIGDPNTIAHLTGITTVADFRRRDIAAGGQGAPLVPVFHDYAFGYDNMPRVIVNIGGMSNISLLTHDDNHLLGFDTGPGNVLINLWAKQYLNAEFDEDGAWGNSGQLNASLLNKLLSDPYFDLPPPKSTGRELFNEAWLLQRIDDSVAPVDIQHTLTQLTSTCISEAVLKYAPNCQEVILCGGGAFNQFLVNSLREQLNSMKVQTSSSLGMDPQWVESTAFAWLAKQTMERKTGNHPNVTGASKHVILGGVYFH